MSGTVEVNPQPTVPSPGAVPPMPFSPPTNPYVTVAQFRTDLPAFSDPATYPDPTVQMFLDLAGVMVNPNRWQQMAVMGMELVTAHFLSLQQSAMQRAQGGAAPGTGTGLLSSKSVSKVSASYDQSTTAIEGGGPWNYTIYGQQYLWWAQLVGTGGYETLALGVDQGMVGTVWTWAMGVMVGWA